MTGTLPNLIMPGAQKSGTTYLAALLAQHPEIFVPEVKEPAHYLALLHSPVLRRNGIARDYAYADRDAYKRLFSEAGTASWRIDASTGYFVFDDIARTIAVDSPETRVICVLRQPSDRAWSAFVYHRQLGQDASNCFDAALDNEQALAATGTISQPLVETGHYARHIAGWREALGESNVLVIIFEEMRLDLQGQLDRITDWLGIARFRPDTESEKNVSHRPLTGWRGKIMSSIFGGRLGGLRMFLKAILPAGWRQSFRTRTRKLLRPKPGLDRVEQIAPDLRARLDAQYSDDISALEAMLGREITVWRRDQ